MIEEIKQSEGFRGLPYDDHMGYPTIGYGTKLPLSKEEGEMLLKFRLEEKRRELYHHLPWLKTQPENVKEVLEEMAYQMGVVGVLRFQKTLALVKEGAYEKASTEMLRSRWAGQTPVRAHNLSQKMGAAS